MKTTAILLAAVCAAMTFGFSGCSTVTDAAGNKTTTFQITGDQLSGLTSLVTAIRSKPVAPAPVVIPAK
jgi:hypothetical protein